MWLIAKYMPTTLFSLKPASATSTGGKSLISPTPFAIKMALLDVAIRTHGLSEGEVLFSEIRRLQIALKPPSRAVINNTFTKIVKPRKGGAIVDSDLNLSLFLINSIAFREYVAFQGELELAFHGMTAEILMPLLLQINYLGKRGGFVQLQTIPEEKSWSDEDLKANGFTLLTESTAVFPMDGLLQMLDDCGPKMTFEHANIYSGKGITLGKERILHHVVLPYRLVRSSKSYSYYERMDGRD